MQLEVGGGGGGRFKRPSPGQSSGSSGNHALYNTEKRPKLR